MIQSIKTVKQPRPSMWATSHNLLSNCATVGERSFSYNLGDKGI